MNRMLGSGLALLSTLVVVLALGVHGDAGGAPAPSEKSAMDEFRARRDAVDEKDIDALYRLALWAEMSGLGAEARDTFARVLVVEPDHQRSRVKLGYELIDGLWLRGPAAMRAKGFVRQDGRWVLAETVDRTAEKNRELEKTAGRHLVALISPDERTRHYAAEALATMPKEALFRPMVAALQGGAVAARVAAVEGLCDRIGTEEAIAAVIRTSVMDQDESVRNVAVSHLAALESPDTIYPYLRALGSSYPAVRTNAAHAIGNLGDIRGVETIVKRLNMVAGGGSRVNFQSLKQISYIRDFDVEIAQLSQVGDPVVGIVREGVILDVRVYKVERDMTVIEKRALTGALRKLTGESIGDDTKAWTSWWNENKAKLRGEVEGD